jgi:hypothetical protein
MQPTPKVNRKNLRRLAWTRGFHGITEVAVAINRSRQQVWRAVNFPHQHKPTIILLEKTLL